MRQYRTRTAVRVFDPVDALARERGLEGARPRPIGVVRLFLLADHTPGAERVYPRPPELVTGQNSRGYVISYGRLRGADGLVLEGTFGGGPFDLRVTSAFYQVTDFTGLRIPATAVQPEPFELLLRPACTYPFPGPVVPPVPDLTGTPPPSLALVRGSVLTPEASGVAEAEVTAPGAIPYRTGADGEWVLAFPHGAPGPVDITITAPATAPVVLDGIELTPGGTTSLAQTALRGRIFAPGIDVTKASVAVAGARGTAGVRNDGVWAYCFPPARPAGSVAVTATLPDGRSHSTTAVVTPRTTTTVPEFSFLQMRSSDA